MCASRNASQFQQAQEFGFADDFNQVSLLDHGFGLSVFGAFLMSSQQVQILIADNKNGGFFGDTAFDFHPCLGRKGCGTFAAHLYFACETGDYPKELAGIVSGFGHGFRVVLSGFVPAQFLDCFVGFFEGGKHDHGGGFGVFFGIVVLKIQPQFNFQVCQTVTSIILEFGPRASGDDDTVVPLHVGKGHGVSFKSGFEGTFVKLAVLDDFMCGHQLHVGFDDAVEWRCAFDHISGYAMNADVEIVKMGEWIDQVFIGRDGSIALNAGNSDLTDTASVRIGSLNVNSDEIIAFLKQVGGINHKASPSVFNYSGSKHVSVDSCKYDAAKKEVA